MFLHPYEAAAVSELLLRVRVRVRLRLRVRVRVSARVRVRGLGLGYGGVGAEGVGQLVPDVHDAEEDVADQVDG